MAARRLLPIAILCACTISIDVPVSIHHTYRSQCPHYNLSLEAAAAILFHSTDPAMKNTILTCELTLRQQDPYLVLLYGVFEQSLALCSGYAPMRFSSSTPLYVKIPHATQSSRWQPAPKLFDTQAAAVNSMIFGGVANVFPKHSIYPTVNLSSVEAVFPVIRDSLADDSFYPVLSSSGLRFLRVVESKPVANFGSLFTDLKVLRLVLFALAGACVFGFVLYVVEGLSKKLVLACTHKIQPMTFHSMWWYLHYCVLLFISLNFDGRQASTRFGRYIVIFWRYVSILLIATLNARVLLSLSTDAHIDSVENLFGNVVGVVNGSNEDYQLSGRGAILRVYPTLSHAVRALVEGHLPTLAVDGLVAGAIVEFGRKTDVNIRAVGEIEQNAYIGILASERLLNRSSINLENQRNPSKHPSDPSNSIAFRTCFRQSLSVATPNVHLLISTWLGHEDVSPPANRIAAVDALSLSSWTIWVPLALVSITNGVFLIRELKSFCYGSMIRQQWRKLNNRPPTAVLSDAQISMMDYEEDDDEKEL